MIINIKFHSINNNNYEISNYCSDLGYGYLVYTYPGEQYYKIDQFKFWKYGIFSIYDFDYYSQGRIDCNGNIINATFHVWRESIKGKNKWGDITYNSYDNLEII